MIWFVFHPIHHVSKALLSQILHHVLGNRARVSFKSRIALKLLLAH
jgi:hypothetical protein